MHWRRKNFMIVLAKVTAAETCNTHTHSSVLTYGKNKLEKLLIKCTERYMYHWEKVNTVPLCQTCVAILTPAVSSIQACR